MKVALIILIVIVVVLGAWYLVWGRHSMTSNVAPYTTGNGGGNYSGSPDAGSMSNMGQSVPPQSNPNPGSDTGLAMDANVAIASFAYSPASLTVKQGTTVIWTNDDSMTHTVTADNGSFASGNLANSQTYSHTFTTKGTFAYHCALHPSMHGSVVVQ